MKTATVQEVIDHLKRFDPNLPFYLLDLTDDEEEMTAYIVTTDTIDCEVGTDPTTGKEVKAIALLFENRKG